VHVATTTPSATLPRIVRDRFGLSFCCGEINSRSAVGSCGSGQVLRLDGRLSFDQLWFLAQVFGFLLLFAQENGTRLMMIANDVIDIVVFERCRGGRVHDGGDGGWL